MNFNLLLHEGTESIKFGMTEQEIQSILNTKPIRFKKTVASLYDTEDYRGICHVYYEKEEDGRLVCSAIEFFKPSKVFLDNIQLMGEQKEKAKNLFISKFDDCISDVSGCKSMKHDIAFYAPKRTVESVFLARKEYSYKRHEFNKKAFDMLYPVDGAEITDPAMRRRLCPKCMQSFIAKEEDKCPNCGIPML